MRQYLRFCGMLFIAGMTGCGKPDDRDAPKTAATATHGQLELRLMSFNIRYETPEDPGSRSWRQRAIGAVRMIQQEAPDIIGVQEALHGQAADLWASLPGYQFFGIGREDGRRAGEYAGIFYREDRFEADQSDCGTFWLSDTPEQAGSKSWGNDIPRVVSWLRLVDRATERGFYVFNTHWDHRHQGSREQAGWLLAQRIGSRKCLQQPVVLLGDFNAVEANAGVAYLTGQRVTLARHGEHIWAHPLIDTFASLHAGEPNRASLHFWGGSRHGSLKVDHILVSQGARVLAAEIRDRDEPMVSDHFPVTAQVAFP